MSFQERQARYRHQYEESQAWRLLRLDNAPLILAYLHELFKEESEVSFSHALLELETGLNECREQGIWETETSAATYLNHWIKAGWLREMDDVLTKTDASEIAMRFLKGLDERTGGTTASHLRIVQEAVRNFAVETSPDANERIILLEHRKAELQREIDALKAGVVRELSESEQRERLREIYQQASELTGDFRRVEDEIRQLDKALRMQIVEGDASRGDILLSMMEKEALLEATDAGSAFESFYQLLCDENLSAELREQLRSILLRPNIAEHLTDSQRSFLAHLMRELGKESDRVFRMRRRTEEGLRAYIESGQAQENRAVNQLLSKLEKAALGLREAGCDPQSKTSVVMPEYPIRVAAPESIKLRMPDEKLDTSGVEERENQRDPSAHMLDCLDAVQIRHVAERAFHTLRNQGPLTIAGLTEKHPLQAGLEELVAYLRVAKSVQAPMMFETESVEVVDKNGVTLQARIPKFLLSVDLFPEQLDELSL